MPESNRLRGLELLRFRLYGTPRKAYNSTYHNPHILKAVQLIHSQVGRLKCIEMGANSGRLGEVLLAANLVTRYIGCDIEPIKNESSSVEVRSCTCEDFLVSERDFVESSNLFIYGDVLEHLVNPWEHLRNLHQSIPNQSYLVVSIPCFFHHSSLNSLGEFRFDYEEWGVMDFTHLRHFSFENIVEMIRVTGFTLADGFPVQYAMDPHGRSIYDKYSSSLPASLDFGKLSIHLSSIQELLQVCSYQFILIATKA
jgi:hypothetical protein